MIIEDRCSKCGTVINDKTGAQRRKFHALCAKIGKELGLTPGNVKMAIKQEEFGIDEFKMGNKWYRGVKSSEDSGRMDYSALIETTFRWAAENGVYLQD